MYTPHTVTLYVVSEGDDYRQNIDTTILRGVFLEAVNAKQVNNTGTNNGDNATLFVPFSVSAEGLDGNPRKYADIRAYREMDDPSGFWTFDPGGDSSPADCYIVKGEVRRTLEYNEAKRLYPNVYTVNRVDTKDYGSPKMHHWQVGCV